ncbi:hypothetical protein GC093_17495 [Paenibacillus sp. LMG 31456]|uniref:LiaF transmembrane domain-containing protein n=1 Tax=Paenibacillus foliorum TaxID=2654974 RepID=A0A972K3J7_9BACL|nr:hypothetical protein [Paenibacillus foliorum]NOU95002.1 hypothetical protein [Paenibacillus foliorum]
MKKWRVGTLSMGITLVLLGAVLFISQWKGLQAFDAFITWWPIIFVLLGLEIVLYLSFSKKENSIVSYDMMSILFVGVLCIGCLGFTMLASVGLLGEVRSMMGAIDETKDLPAVKETVADGVKKVIVQSQDQSVKVDKSQERSVQVFGTYRSRVKQGEQSQPLEKEQFVAVRTIGDTMYVQVKRLPERRGFDSFYPWMTATVVLPQDVQIEVRGANNQMIE